MREFSKLNGFDIKDKTARDNHAALVAEINGLVTELNTALEKLENKIESGGGESGGGVENVIVDVLSMIKTRDTATFKNLTNRYRNGEIVITAKVELENGSTITGIVTGVGYRSETDMDWTVSVPTTSFTHMTYNGTTIDTASMSVYVLDYNGTSLSIAEGNFPLPKGEATTAEAGLMSASDKAKLDGITASADSVIFTQTLTSGTQIGLITINGTNKAIYAPTPSSGSAGGLPTFTTVAQGTLLTEDGLYILLGPTNYALRVNGTNMPTNKSGMMYLRIEGSGWCVYTETSGAQTQYSNSFGDSGGASVSWGGQAFRYVKIAEV